MWLPPEPVWTLTVGTSSGCCAVSPARLTSPPWGGSMSITTRPLAAPVRMATLAVGHRRHQAAIVAGSVVAAGRPVGTPGCLPGDVQSGWRHEQKPPAPGEWHGKTAQPRPAYSM